MLFKPTLALVTLAASAQAIAIDNTVHRLQARLTPLQAAQAGQSAINAIASISSGLGSAAASISANGGGSTSASSGSTGTTASGSGTASGSSSASANPNACTSTNAQVCNEQALALSAHNTARAAYGAAPLVWDQALADAATRWGQNCKFQHSGGSLLTEVYGENLYANSAPEPYTTVTDAVNAWMGEAPDYNYNNPQFTEAAGHFTQVVWAATTHIGCAVTDCVISNFGGTTPNAFIVCEYFPAGNYAGEFAANVHVKSS